MKYDYSNSEIHDLIHGKFSLNEERKPTDEKTCINQVFKDLRDLNNRIINDFLEQIKDKDIENFLKDTKTKKVRLMHRFFNSFSKESYINIACELKKHRDFDFENFYFFLLIIKSHENKKLSYRVESFLFYNIFITIIFLSLLCGTLYTTYNLNFFSIREKYNFFQEDLSSLKSDNRMIAEEQTKPKEEAVLKSETKTDTKELATQAKEEVAPIVKIEPESKKEEISPVENTEESKEVEENTVIEPIEENKEPEELISEKIVDEEVMPEITAPIENKEIIESQPVAQIPETTVSLSNFPNLVAKALKSDEEKSVLMKLEQVLMLQLENNQPLQALLVKHEENLAKRTSNIIIKSIGYETPEQATTYLDGLLPLFEQQQTRYSDQIAQSQKEIEANMQNTELLEKLNTALEKTSNNKEILTVMKVIVEDLLQIMK